MRYFQDIKAMSLPIAHDWVVCFLKGLNGPEHSTSGVSFSDVVVIPLLYSYGWSESLPLYCN